MFSFSDTWSAWANRFFTDLSAGDLAKASELGALVGYDFERGEFARDSVVIAGTPVEIALALAPGLPDRTQMDLVRQMNEIAEEAPAAEAAPLVPLLSELLARGLKLGVATNDAESPARANLSSFGVEGMFDFIAGSDSGYGFKPEPGMLLAFSGAVGVPAASCVMVGDSTHDLRAGAAAGMRTVAVLTGMAGPSDLAPYADIVLPDIGHIPAWLDEIEQL